MKIRIAFIGVLCAFMVGCAQTGKGKGALIGPLSAAGIVNVDPTSNSVAVSDALPDGASSLGQVQGTSCKNSLIDPAPTEDSAMTQLKQKALNMGANGVAGVTYKRGGLSYATNCWSTVTAIGTAYRSATSSNTPVDG